MVTGGMMDITEDEAELYDRQIRLWGIDSQRRLRTAKILIVGIKGFGAEIAKNIILSGVKSVTLLDHENVSIEDSAAQFFVSSEAIGQNRASASVKRAQALNPMVNVTADPEDVRKKGDEYFWDFDVVVVTNCSLSEQKRINASCRLRGVKFFCGDVFGMFGYSFADLQVHEYVEEITSLGKVKKVTTVKRNKNFVPLEEAVNHDWTQETPRRLKKIDPSYFLMLVLHAFEKQEKRIPDRKEREKDIEKLKELAKTTLKELSLPEDKIPDSLIGNVFGEVSPVCAILGGVLAQDIIKTVSQKGAPLDNFFFFNPDRCCGFVEYVANP